VFPVALVLSLELVFSVADVGVLFVAQVRLHADVSSVRLDCDCSLSIGAPYGGSDRIQPLEHFRGRMAETVAATAADEGDGGTPGVQQL
jgi:hypothetical protein